MAQSKTIDELAADMEATNRRLAAAGRALQNAQIEKLKLAEAQLRLKMLETEIRVLENDIQTIIYMQRTQGREPDVDKLRRHLAAKQKELESLAAEYHLELSKPRRWWQFWK